MYILEVSKILPDEIEDFLEGLNEKGNFKISTALLNDIRKFLYLQNERFAGAYYGEKRDLVKLKRKSLTLESKANSVQAKIVVLKPKLTILKPSRMIVRVNGTFYDGVTIQYLKNKKYAAIYLDNFGYHLERRLKENKIFFNKIVPERRLQDKLKIS